MSLEDPKRPSMPVLLFLNVISALKEPFQIYFDDIKNIKQLVYLFFLFLMLGLALKSHTTVELKWLEH